MCAPRSIRRSCDRYLVARVLARALEHAEGLEFSKLGVSDDSWSPALVQRDLRGDLTAWIEIGNPSPERLHKAAKACKRVVVYTWKSAAALREAIAEFGVHRGDQIEVIGLAPDLLDCGRAVTLDRVNRWDLSVTARCVVPHRKRSALRGHARRARLVGIQG